MITDFEGAGVTLGDVISLDARVAGVGEFSELLPFMADVVGGCEIRFSTTEILSLRDVSVAQLDASDFSFVT